MQRKRNGKEKDTAEDIVVFGEPLPECNRRRRGAAGAGRVEQADVIRCSIDASGAADRTPLFSVFARAARLEEVCGRRPVQISRAVRS